MALAALVLFALAWQAGADSVSLVVWPSLSAAAAAWLILSRSVRRARTVRRPFPSSWRRTLERYVRYYGALSAEEKRRFERDVALFIDEAVISGVGTGVNDDVRVLVASSAVMLVFGRPQWEYADLPEILVYPQTFDERFRCSIRGDIAGMVVPRNALVLSKPVLVWSFRRQEPYHVGLHEFAHVLDMEDGQCDGVPRGLTFEAQRRWQAIVARERERALHGQSVLGDYAATHEAELFAVAVEHFFQAPRPLRARHPELYGLLQDYLNQDPAGRS